MPNPAYDWPWRRLRKRHLAQHPWCVRCGARGVDVDHVVPVRVAPHRRLDPTNLQTLCHPCHSKVTQWHDNPHAKRNPQRGATVQGLPLDPNHPWAGHTTPKDQQLWRKGRPLR